MRSILAWIERGVAVSKVGKILAKTESVQPVSTLISSDLVRADHARWQQQVADAVSNFDDVELDRVYGQVFFHLYRANRLPGHPDAALATAIATPADVRASQRMGVS
nr:hypothetical protein GCM10020185_48220 [Pseudomonas brassicacearum subsp. brassicacearum]